MHSFVRNLVTEWRKLNLPFAGETFIVAVSGGADSVSLLLALRDLKQREKLNLRLVVAHFNHHLRGDEADNDEEFVRGLTLRYGCELAIGKGNISHEGNLEQNARAARYDFLGKTAENLQAYGVLTGHTLNDQAETFLMNLLRGSGMEGLGGMKPVRILEKVNKSSTDSSSTPLLPFSSSPLLLVRPLLNWAKRTDTEKFCHESGVEYRYDTMNEDLAFKRVRIRKILIPLLEDFNPKIIETLANTANLMQQKSEPLSSPPVLGGVAEGRGGATGFLEKDKIEHSDELKLGELKALNKSDLYLLLRQWLGRHRGNLRLLELKHIEAIERLIFSPKSGKTVELPGGEMVVKHKGKLVFDKIKVEK